MKSSLFLILLNSISIEGFLHPTLASNTRIRNASGGRLFMSSYKERLADVQRSRGTAPAKETETPPAPAVAPSPFDDDMQEHLSEAISILSRRLQSGEPLSREEFSRFQAAANAIIEDCKEYGSNTFKSPEPKRAPARSQTQPVRTENQESLDSYEGDEENEGPAWDEDKGYGVPVGTTNTYVVEGMDKMTPEEYQDAIRQKVINRAQAARKTGRYGNINANAYFDFLSGKNVPETPAEDFKEY